jgi:hypothetical protein
MGAMIKDGYPYLAGIDLSKVTTQQLQEAFGQVGSGDTVRKAITFFIPAAKDAGIKLSPYIKEPGKRSPGNGRSRKARTPRDEGRAEDGDNRQDPPATPKQPATMQELLMAKFPSFDPSWPDELKTKWFESFTDLMKRADK